MCNLINIHTYIHTSGGGKGGGGERGEGGAWGRGCWTARIMGGSDGNPV